LFFDRASVSGRIDGGLGSDTLNYARYTSASVSVSLTKSGATGFGGSATAVAGGFSGIDNALGGAGVNDALTGRPANSTWTIDTTFRRDVLPGAGDRPRAEVHRV